MARPSERSQRIDLGLAISGALLKPGETRTQQQLASFAGCSQGLIYAIELRALKKLRHPSRLKRLTDH